MATKTVHVCDRCAAEQSSALKAVTVSLRGEGAQETRDLCGSCLQQLAWFFSSPADIRVDTESAVPGAVVPIGRMRKGRS